MRLVDVKLRSGISVWLPSGAKWPSVGINGGHFCFAASPTLMIPAYHLSVEEEEGVAGMHGEDAAASRHPSRSHRGCS